jgi:hypothetical protein
MFILNEGDAAFLYEGLARAAFDNCSKAQDPWGYAKQEVYDNFVGEISLRGKRALSAIIAKVIIDKSKHENEIERLTNLDDNIWELENQEDVLDWLYELKKEMEALDY